MAEKTQQTIMTETYLGMIRQGYSFDILGSTITIHDRNFNHAQSKLEETLLNNSHYAYADYIVTKIEDLAGSVLITAQLIKTKR